MKHWPDVLYRLLKWADTSNLVTPITMDPIIADPMRALRMNSVTYYIRGGLKKVQMNETPIIFLRKRYGSVVVHIQS
jgi:hypothetical protein